MEVAPFFVDIHHLLSIFTIFYRFSRFTHFCRDLHFVAIYALFPQIFFGQNSLLRNITRFLHVWSDPASESIAAESAKYSSLAVIIMVNTPTASNFQSQYMYLRARYL